MATNQCAYNLSELRVFDRTNNTEMVPEVLKKRKRSAGKGGKDRRLPMTLIVDPSKLHLMRAMLTANIAVDQRFVSKADGAACKYVGSLPALLR